MMTLQADVRLIKKLEYFIIQLMKTNANIYFDPQETGRYTELISM